MCGVVVVAGPVRETVVPLAAMSSALRHRGPDDEGYLLADTRTGAHEAFAGPDSVAGLGLRPLAAASLEQCDLGLAHRRLSIIDLGHGGHGPMGSPDRAHWISYNGEIFNYVELRDELGQLGHVFRTASDTEVLLAAYAQWGEGALDRLNGMWAFALYDARRRVLLCSRDRFGVKPFYYFWDGRNLAGASEIKALLRHPLVTRRPHLPLLAGFLTDGIVDEGERTFFEDVRCLPAGHLLRLELVSRELSVSRWYEPPQRTPQPGNADELRNLLEDAVRLRLRSDVDVGTCLSGGLDSSSIVCLTARLRRDGRDARHRSFSIVYPDAELDESRFIDEVVARTGVEAFRDQPSASDLQRDLPALVAAQDEPMPSAGPYSQWRVMRLAHQAGMKVLLDGQGSDEIFAGYHYHFGPYLAELARGAGLSPTLRALNELRQVTGRPLAFLLGLLAYHLLPIPEGLRRAAVARAATHGRLPAGMLDPSLLGDQLPIGQRHRPRRTLAEELRANLAITSLPALLRFEDRNSMAFSIEARTPFLDYRLVEWATALPAADLIRHGWSKAILRDAMRGILPEPVRLRRDKIGFGTPERRWLRELAPAIRGWLSPGARVREFLRPGALDRWLAGSDAELSRRPGLWRLLCLEHWLRHAELAVG